MIMQMETSKQKEKWGGRSGYSNTVVASLVGLGRI